MFAKLHKRRQIVRKFALNEVLKASQATGALTICLRF